MSASTFTCVPNNDTDAHYRAWGSAVAAAFASFGLVKTGDTGQIDWTTVTAPASSGVFPGYEIWRFADTLQATAPVFMKVEYGSWNSSGNPAIRFTVSTGSDGAGALTGTTSGAIIARTNSTHSAALNCYVSGSTNRFALALWAGSDGQAISSALPFFLMIERTVDEVGAPTAEGVLLLWKNRDAGTWNQVVWTPTGLATSVETTMGCMAPQNGSGTAGSQTSVYPLYYSKGCLLPAGLNVLGYIEANFTAWVTATFDFYGASRTYLPIAAGVTGFTVSRTPLTTTFMMRFD